MKLICYVISAILFIGPFLVIRAILNEDGRVSMFLSALLIAFGFALASGVHFVVMKTFNWLTGSLTLDRAYKSSADYDHY